MKKILKIIKKTDKNIITAFIISLTLIFIAFLFFYIKVFTIKKRKDCILKAEKNIKKEWEEKCLEKYNKEIDNYEKQISNPQKITIFDIYNFTRKEVTIAPIKPEPFNPNCKLSKEDSLLLNLKLERSKKYCLEIYK